MMSIVSGLVVFGAGGGALWPHNSAQWVPHRLAKVPFLNSLNSNHDRRRASAVGVALVINGFA